MRPETELLLACLRTDYRQGETTPLPGGVDWSRFVSLCEWHHVVPLVCRTLPGVLKEAAPPAVVSRLRGLHHSNTARSLLLATELTRVLHALESSGISACPFKGPALSVMIYGDPACRQSKDLDILVPGQTLRRAVKVLGSLGYGSGRNWDGPQLSAHRRTEYEAVFARRDGKLQVELQWAVVPAYFGFDHEEMGIWSRLENRAWGAMNFPVLPPEETLLMLCVHGAKHLWCKLGWVCDVAGLLESGTPPDLLRSLELAGRCGVTRLLLLGLLLAERLAGARLPQEVWDRLEADSRIAVLARRVLDIIAKTPVNPDADPARYLFYAKSKDNRWDQLLFAGRLLSTLAAGEWNPSALPDILAPFYFLFRPLHMAGRHGEPILRALARKKGTVPFLKAR